MDVRVLLLSGRRPKCRCRIATDPPLVAGRRFALRASMVLVAGGVRLGMYEWGRACPSCGESRYAYERGASVCEVSAVQIAHFALFGIAFIASRTRSEGGGKNAKSRVSQGRATQPAPRTIGARELPRTVAARNAYFLGPALAGRFKAPTLPSKHGLHHCTS